NVRLTVTNDLGLADSTSKTITVNQGNHAPVANAGGLYRILAGHGVTLNGQASFDSDTAFGDYIAGYLWDINGDGVYGDATGSSPTLTWAQLQTFNITAQGSYTVRLRVTDTL